MAWTTYVLLCLKVSWCAVVEVMEESYSYCNISGVPRTDCNAFVLSGMSTTSAPDFTERNDHIQKDIGSYCSHQLCIDVNKCKLQ